MLLSTNFKTCFQIGAAKAAFNTTNTRITIYKGSSKPTDLYSSNFNPSSYTSDLLLTYSGNTTLFTNTGGTVYIQTLPSSVAATGTGTATWGAIYLPASAATSIVGDVSLNGGGGIIILPTLSITSGSVYNLVDVSWTFV